MKALPVWQQHQLLRYVESITFRIFLLKWRDWKTRVMYLLSTTQLAALCLEHQRGAGWSDAYCTGLLAGGWKTTTLSNCGKACSSKVCMAAPAGQFWTSVFYDAARRALPWFCRRHWHNGGHPQKACLVFWPDALNNLHQTRFPSSWKFTTLSVPDISISFKQEENSSVYQVTQSYSRLLNITLQIKAQKKKLLL